MKEYDHKKIEKKWQKVWGKDGLYKAEDKSRKPKYYCLIEFPYPSGDGLHVGHIRSNTAMDIIARKRRAEGHNVLYPIGWDAFGLPTENYAIKTKTPPKVVTKENTDTFRRQLQSLGFSFDWSREINTTDPKYYKWTQWMFLQFFKKGLAYKKKTSVNWCLNCKIGLANEEVVDGLCERCGGLTEKREKEQWMLAITKYADRLYDDLDSVDYPERVKIQQRNWIGKSEGAEIQFTINNSQLTIKVFTTRPDTLFGATYMVLAPDHDLVFELKDKIKNLEEVEKYIIAAKKKTEIERMAEGKEKTGVELVGIRAINPANKEEIPVWIADYVLKEYGTGAIMAVPAHDERDYGFAKKFKLPIRVVVEPETGEKLKGEEFRRSIVAVVEDTKQKKFLTLNWGLKLGGRLFIGGGIEEGEDAVKSALREIKEETGYTNLELVSRSEKMHHHYFAFSKNIARETEVDGLYFRLKDDTRDERTLKDDEHGNFEIEWVNKEEAISSIKDENHLLVFRRLVLDEAYVGCGRLINSGKFDGVDSEKAKKKITEFVGGQMKTTYKLRDWVFSRQRYWGEPIPLVFCEKDKWVPVSETDLPLELPEVKAYTPTDTGESPLAKIDSWVNVKCPKCGAPAKRETDTMPNWAGSSWYFLAYIMQGISNFQFPISNYKKVFDYWMPVDWYNGGMEHTTLHLLYSRFWHKFLFDIGAVPNPEPYAKRTSHGLILAEGGEKMSKSKDNVVNPDSIITMYGADTLRLYEMFMGPFDQPVAWSTDSIVGPRRFLERVWKLKSKIESQKPEGENNAIKIILNKTIKKVGEDIESMRFNTAVSGLMILMNEMEKRKPVRKEHYEIFLRLLAPFVPHIAEELWSELGHDSSIHNEPWPKHDETKLSGDTQTIVIQINGKVRGSFIIPISTKEEEIKARAFTHETTQKWLAGKEPKRVVYIPGKLVSIVV